MNPEITADTIKAWLPGTFPGDMAIEPVEITDEVSTGRMVVDERHLHPGGFVHGGVWTALGDSVAYGIQPQKVDAGLPRSGFRSGCVGGWPHSVS